MHVFITYLREIRCAFGNSIKSIHLLPIQSNVFCKGSVSHHPLLSSMQCRGQTKAHFSLSSCWHKLLTNSTFFKNVQRVGLVVESDRCQIISKEKGQAKERQVYWQIRQGSRIMHGRVHEEQRQQLRRAERNEENILIQAVRGGRNEKMKK